MNLDQIKTVNSIIDQIANTVKGYMPSGQPEMIANKGTKIPRGFVTLEKSGSFGRHVRELIAVRWNHISDTAEIEWRKSYGRGGLRKIRKVTDEKTFKIAREFAQNFDRLTLDMHNRETLEKQASFRLRERTAIIGKVFPEIADTENRGDSVFFPAHAVKVDMQPTSGESIVSVQVNNKNLAKVLKAIREVQEAE